MSLFDRDFSLCGDVVDVALPRLSLCAEDAAVLSNSLFARSDESLGNQLYTEKLGFANSRRIQTPNSAFSAQTQDGIGILRPLRDTLWSELEGERYHEKAETI